MTKTRMFALSCLFGLFTLTACNSTGRAVVPTPVPSAAPQPILEYKSLSTPASTGQMVIYKDLQLTMSQAEMTAGYPTEYGSTREPPADKKFLWIHILIKNTSLGERDLPAPEHFSVINGETEYKPTYGHRKDHVDYMALLTGMVQGQEADAWLRFDIPAALELMELRFVFMPESLQISVGFSSSDYPWANNPIYLWRCAP
jgi:hypothetical protein